MTEPRPVHHLPRWLLACAGLLMAGMVMCPARVSAQDAARPTGDFVLSQLEKAQQALATQAQQRPELPLTPVVQQLAKMGEVLRKQLGSNTAQPVDILGEAAKAQAKRASAAAQRAQSYLTVASGCQGEAAKALVAALALNVQQLAAQDASAKGMAPVIDAVETGDHQSLFVIHPGAMPLDFAVTGSDLLDPQCANPVVSLTDAQGKPVASQLVITAASPQRLAFKLADRSALALGGYVVHVVPQRKAFLLGCTKLPEAVAALQVVPRPEVQVEYTLSASCQASGSGGTMVLAHGRLTAAAHPGAAVPQVVDVSACPSPLSYTITATAHAGSDAPTTVGPITQPADAGITAGLPGGLSLSWNPAIHSLFVTTQANTCRGSE